VGLKLNGTHQHLTYADDVNLLGDNIETINKDTETFIVASNDVGLEKNVEKADQNRDIKRANRLFQNVSQFKYLGTTITNQNLIQEEVSRRHNSGIVCYHSVQNLLSSHRVSKNVKIRIYKTIILSVVLYGCETCSLALREEHKLRVFEKRVLRRIFGLKRDEVMREWRRLHNKELHDLYSSPSITGIIKLRRMRWAGHVA
jgi:hypothetical protein